MATTAPATTTMSAGGAGGTSGTSGIGGIGGTGTTGCDIEAAMFTCQGSICHGTPGVAPTATLGSGLDLFGPDRLASLMNIPANYEGVVDTSTCPNPPELRIDSANPANSLMIKKLLGTQLCGDPMPFAPVVIEEADKQCIIDWVNMVAQMGTVTSGGTMGTVGTTGAGGMTSTGSSMGTVTSTGASSTGSGSTGMGSTGMGSTGMGSTGMGGSTGSGSTGMGGMANTTMATGAGGSMAAGGSSGF